MCSFRFIKLKFEKNSHLHVNDNSKSAFSKMSNKKFNKTLSYTFVSLIDQKQYSSSNPTKIFFHTQLTFLL